MKRMLINATQPEELRVALVDGQHLYNLDIETPGREQKKSNIYKGKITRIEPSLEAAFLDYGAERHGFLPLKEVAPSCFRSSPASDRRVDIKDVLQEGQELVVQIAKEERGSKGAALTTYISLAGRYLVLMPNNPRAGGISRRIEGDERTDLREVINSITIPEGMGMIVRTAGVGKSPQELQWDLDYLVNLWQAIETASTEKAAPFLVYQESDIIIRAIRDYLRPDIGEILIDDKEVFDRAHDFMRQVMPHNLSKIKLYQDGIPLFSRYQIESQIEAAFQHELRLPSGGSVVFDHTEALVSIDINSSRATKGGDIEETALSTNLEAADEIARQLRLRDIGGLIVIDFIDMTPVRNQREVENRLREALKKDRARIQMGRISRFGLLEMSRQRLRPSLGEYSQENCPRCKGLGSIRSVESLALSILRIIEEDAMKDNTARIVAQLPVNIATYLLNEKRDAVTEMEKRHDIDIFLIANSALDTPNYGVKRFRKDEAMKDETLSYEMATPVIESKEQPAAPGQKAVVEKPAVQSVVPSTPVPKPSASTATPAKRPDQEIEGGFIKRLWSSLFGANNIEPAKPEQPDRPRDQRRKSQSARTAKRRGKSSQSSQNRGGQQRRNDQSSGRRKHGSQNTRPAAEQAQNKTADDQQAAAGKSGDQQTTAQGGVSSETTNERRKPQGQRSRRGNSRRQQRGQSRSTSQQQGKTQNRQPDSVTATTGTNKPETPTQTDDIAAMQSSAESVRHPIETAPSTNETRADTSSASSMQNETVRNVPEQRPVPDVEQSSVRAAIQKDQSNIVANSGRPTTPAGPSSSPPAINNNSGNSKATPPQAPDSMPSSSHLTQVETTKPVVDVVHNSAPPEQRTQSVPAPKFVQLETAKEDDNKDRADTNRSIYTNQQND